MENEKGESKGFGFVNYEKPEEAQAAVDKLNGTMINEKELFVGRAQKRQERDEELRHQREEQSQKYQGANVYVKNLDDNVDDEKLKQEFSRFGTITSAKVMTDERGNSKGFGFVWFTNPEEASRAITEMNGMIFGTKPLYASLAQRKDVRRQQLAAMHQQKVNMMQMNMGMMNMRGNMPGMFPPAYYPQMPGMPRMNQPYPPQMIPRPPRFVPNGPAANPPSQPGNPAQAQQPRGAGANGPAQGGFQNGTSAAQRGGGRPRNPRPPPAGGQPASGGRGRGGQNAQGQLNRGYKYTSTARNQPEPAEQQQQQQPQDFAGDKQSAGELLYGLIINKTNPMLAGKITGMLLESHHVPELYDIARMPELLDSKINEALAVLQAHQDETPHA